MGRRVDLNGQDITGIQDLHKDRKTRVVVPVAKYLGALTDPELVQRDAAKFDLGNDTLGVVTVDKLPRLANRIRARQLAFEMGLQFTTTPNSFHVQGLKGEAFGVHILCGDLLSIKSSGTG